MKYWHVSYQQASDGERLSLTMFAIVMLVYTWWAILVFYIVPHNLLYFLFEFQPTKPCEK